MKKFFKIIAPSSAFYIDNERFSLAQKRLDEMNIKIEIGTNIGHGNFMGTASIKDRVEELVSAFSDLKIDAIMSIIGGTNSEELLDFLPYDFIAKYPKPLFGFSDITVLQNALFSQCGLISFSSPHFSSLSMIKGCEYSLENLQKTLSSHSYRVYPSQYWSDDLWFLDQENRKFYSNDGWKILNHGSMEGTVIGGNLMSLATLFGTKYMPDLKDSIVFVEEAPISDDGEDATFSIFLRNIGALFRQKGAEKIKGLVIGRFHSNAGVSDQHLEYILESHPFLRKIPVIANVDFGHTTPVFTFPIGGHCSFNGNEDNPYLEFSY